MTAPAIVDAMELYREHLRETEELAGRLALALLELDAKRDECNELARKLGERAA